mgnify:CR=1 FL=1
MSTKGVKPVASNRKARHDYEILDTFEAGMAQLGGQAIFLGVNDLQKGIEEFERLTGVKAVYGGAPMGPQVHSLRKGASVVVATPC